MERRHFPVASPDFGAAWPARLASGSFSGSRRGGCGGATPRSPDTRLGAVARLEFRPKEGTRHRLISLFESRRGCASGARRFRSEKRLVPVAHPLLEEEKHKSPRVRRDFRVEKQLAQVHGLFFVSITRFSAGATPSRNRERVVPVAQPVLRPEDGLREWQLCFSSPGRRFPVENLGYLCPEGSSPLAPVRFSSRGGSRDSRRPVFRLDKEVCRSKVPIRTRNRSVAAGNYSFSGRKSAIAIRYPRIQQQRNKKGTPKGAFSVPGSTAEPSWEATRRRSLRRPRGLRW